MDDWSFLSADGRVAQALRARDWRASPLGPPSGWPDLLRSTLATILTSPQPMFISWGPALTFLYNDAYEGILGLKAEGGPGRAFPDVWPDIWEDIRPLVERAYAGEGSSFEDFPLTMLRHGHPEETWWTFSYNPLRDAQGAVRGMLCAALETSARVRADQHAGAERQRLATMFDSAPGFMAILEGPEHRFALVNPAYQRIVGHRDVLGRPLAEALPEAADQGFVALLDRVRDTGEPVAMRGARLSLPPGPGLPPEDRWLDFVYQPFTDAEGRVAGVFVEGHDVTEAHRAQEVLRASEARFRTLFDAMDQAVVIFEKVATPEGAPSDYRYAMMNGPARAAFGLPPEADGDSTRLRRPEADEAWYAAFDQVIATGEPIRAERRSPRLGRVYEAHVAPLGGPGAKQILTVTRDVTEQRQAEEALRDQNLSLERRVASRTAELRLLANIVETTDAFIQVMDPHLRWLGINRAAADQMERDFGARPRVGDALRAVLAARPDILAAMESLWGRALRGEAFTDSARFEAATGTPVTLEMKFDALRDRDGRVTAAFQIASDVTDRVRAEARLMEAEDQLRQAQKMEAIGQLTGGVAHDFNNLLTPIVGALDVLQRRALGGAREQRLIEGAMQSAERARTLVSRLLAFARRQPLQVGPVDLAHLVEGLRHLIVSTVGPQVRVDVHVAGDLPPAVADGNQLEMAILNLAVNARDAMPQGGSLTVSAAREEAGEDHPQRLQPGTYLRLWVEDTGAGMDDAVRERAIEPFFSTKGTGRGTGLGLSMVHGLALQLGGALGIESVPGEGTRVTLWLPAARGAGSPAAIGWRGEARPLAPKGDRPAWAGGQGAAALLVDDEALVRAATADMLADLGYRVTAAASGEEALRLVDEGLAPDLLVTDHLMPGMTGTDLARRLLGARPGLPVLIVSGFAEGSGLEPGLPRLSKPFRRDELAASLERLRR